MSRKQRSIYASNLRYIVVILLASFLCACYYIYIRPPHLLTSDGFFELSIANDNSAVERDVFTSTSSAIKAILQTTIVRTKEQTTASHAMNMTKRATTAEATTALPKNTPRRYLQNKVLLQKYLNYLNQPEPPLPKQNKAVLILTNYRSGSSFFGEFFKQHPDVFYIYEPLWPLCHFWDCTNNRQMRVSTLQGLLQCDLPNWTNIYEDIGKEGRIPTTNPIIGNCLRRGICFTEQTRGLCGNKHCPGTRPVNCFKDCGSLNFPLVNNECRRSQLVAMKIIRLCDILDIADIVTKLSADTDIKILHLIRDPRAITNSARKLPSGINILNMTASTCKRQAHNLASAVFGTPEWLKGRYKVIRFEDLAMNPYGMGQEVYDFVGLSFPMSVKKWIEKNTKLKIPIEKPATVSTSEAATIKPIKVVESSVESNVTILNMNITAESKTTELKLKSDVKHERKRRAAENSYGTTRDSRTVVQKWATELPYNMAKDVEARCSDIMKLGGYIKIGTAEEYKTSHDKTYFTDDMEIIN